MAANDYPYSPLESDSSFRLLRLSGGRQNDKLVGSLHHFLLDSDDCPLYRAISYTWDEDLAEDGLHTTPRGYIIPIRNNLRNALLSFRTPQSHCWLWIDAICIDQASKSERNHQVKVMGQIYSNANIVSAWLQSAYDRPGFTGELLEKAYITIRNIALLSQDSGSILKAIADERKSEMYDLEAITELCKLRYWTRKWIIQELVIARTTVVHYDGVKYPFEEFENFCLRIATLIEHRDPKVDRRTLDVQAKLRDVSKSPTVRLALDRAEARNLAPRRFLWDLVKTYADSSCGIACDHVYALYNLVGAHRTRLRIDYAITPIQRLHDVLQFMIQEEDLPPNEAVDTALRLMQKFEIQAHSLPVDSTITRELILPISVHALGEVQFLPESHQVLDARDNLKSVFPMPLYCFSKQNDTYQYTETRINSQQDIGPQDMIYFGLQNSKTCGLASCRMRLGDKIWHLPQTKLSFVVRETAGGATTILGRAYVFEEIQNIGVGKTWREWPYSDFSHSAVKPARVIHLNVAVMIALTDLANAHGESVKEEAEEKAAAEALRAAEEAKQLKQLQEIKRRQEAEARAAENAELKGLENDVADLVNAIRETCEQWRFEELAWCSESKRQDKDLETELAKRRGLSSVYKSVEKMRKRDEHQRSRKADHQWKLKERTNAAEPKLANWMLDLQRCYLFLGRALRQEKEKPPKQTLDYIIQVLNRQHGRTLSSLMTTTISTTRLLRQLSHGSMTPLWHKTLELMEKLGEFSCMFFPFWYASELKGRCIMETKLEIVDV